MWFRTNRPESETPSAGNTDGAVSPGSPAPDPEASRPQSALATLEIGPPLSPGRAALAEAIALLRSATGAMETAARPARRLDYIIAEARNLDQLLADHAANYERALGAWLVNGSQGERPAPAPAAVGLRQRRAEIDVDLAAAEKALPAAQKLEQEAASCAAAASYQLAEALPLAACDAASEVIEAELIPAITQVLEVEARLVGLVSALREAGDRPNNPLPGAIGISVQIAELIRDGKRRPGISIAVDRARRFLDALASDAEALL